jgi:dTDP-4-dehydrorhamnose 3,5-epimerase-like enzyme
MNSLVTVIDLAVHVDDRGLLYEVLRDDRPDMMGGATSMRQAYIVQDHADEIVRAFHVHRKMYDWFCVVSGAAKFVFCNDDRIRLANHDYSGSTDNPIVQEVALCAAKAQCVNVPPGVWHGWRALTENVILVSIASKPYLADAPDEERVWHGILGESVWDVKYR